jgi:predicted TIM-barrel fold metal-dependent hydrolase
MTATIVELADVEVVDNHCHSLDRVQDQRDVAGWRALFTESPDAQVRAVEVAETVSYQRLVTDLSAHHGTDGEEHSLLEVRANLGTRALAARMLADAAIGTLVVDTGFPDPQVALSVPDLAAAAGCRAVALLRLEPELERLVVAHASYDEVAEATDHLVRSLRGHGFVGLKSVVGYRTGLDVRRWERSYAIASFAEARQEVAERGAVRLGHKPLLDSLLHVALAAAADDGLPVQLHVGYGDPDADLRSANPLLLRDLLEEPAYRPVPFVLLHGCWPFVREGGYLASVYGNAHLDLSYAIPFLSRQELRSMTRAAFSVAPASRLLYSSDGARVPELHWAGAREGRRAIGGVLAELVDDGDLTPAQARRAGERVLRDNASALYGLGGG